MGSYYKYIYIYIYIDILHVHVYFPQAFFSGKLKVVGNIMLGPKLETIFKDELSKL